MTLVGNIIVSTLRRFERVCFQEETPRGGLEGSNQEEVWDGDPQKANGDVWSGEQQQMLRGIRGTSIPYAADYYGSESSRRCRRGVLKGGISCIKREQWRPKGKGWQ